jgi:hypothetical protein
MTGAVENVPQTGEPPPIAMLLPLLQSALTGSSLFVSSRDPLASRHGVPVTHYLVHRPRVALAHHHHVVKTALDIVLFTPFSIIRMVAVALYPVYVFCAVACIFGATVGIFGQLHLYQLF